MPTRDQPLERPRMLLLTCTTLPFLSKDRLYAIKKVLRNKWFMDTVIVLSCPCKIPIIKTL